MKVLVTGSCGYKGSVLIPKLSRHEVTTLDIGWFGGVPHIKKDIRECGKDFLNVDAIIHLAGIANDPCGELDAKLTWEVNVLGTMRLAEWAVRSGVKQFIFASSASVYGIHEGRELIETDQLAPVSDYNKTKMCAERILLSYSDNMAIQIIRPATVCGWSPRMRLDTMVNMLTYQALSTGQITAHCGEVGGELMRPNIHIDDITDLYVFMLEHPNYTGIYNAGFENISALETAKLIAKHIPAAINITQVKDKRNYRINSDKLLVTDFEPRFTVEDAIIQLKDKWHSGQLKASDMTTNLTWMKINGWAT